ncbi:MAG: vitamin K epoxide reductase family protein [Ktedonobacteraceae bacterium]
MSLLRRSGSQVALLVLAVLGIADAIYLTIAHYDESVTLVCSDSGFINCARVITSRYSYVPGTSLPISLPGLAWCLVIAVLALLGMFLGAEQRWLRLAQFAWTLLGMLTVLYLVYVEIVLLDNLCAWCTVLHVLILLMFLIALARLPGHVSEDEFPT